MLWLDKLFSHKAWNKKVPLTFIAALTEDEKAELLKGLFLGDGTKSDYTYTLTLTSPHVIMSCWLMLVGMGIRAGISEINLETLNQSLLEKEDAILHKRPMYRVRIPRVDTGLFEDKVLFRSEPHFDMKGRRKARPSKTSEGQKSVSVWFTPENFVQSCLIRAKTVKYKGFVFNIEVSDTESYCLPYMSVHNCRNMYIGGGGPNLGSKNKLWLELKGIVKEVYGGLLTWHQFEKQMLKGNLDQKIKDWMIKVRLEDGWDGACFLPGHNVVSNKGTRPFLDIGAKTRVLSLEGKDSIVVASKESWYKGDIIKLEGVNCIPATVTPNHKILVVEREKCVNSQATKNRHCRPDCSSLEKKFREDKRNNKWSGVYKNCSILYSHEVKWVQSKDIIPHKHCFLYPKVGLNKEGVDNFNLEKCELWGWYLAEGYSSKENTLQFALHLYNDPHDRVINLIKTVYDTNVNVYNYPKKTCKILSSYVGKDQISELKTEFGKKALVKRIPPIVFQFNKEQLERFLYGAFHGDGCIYSKPGSKYKVVCYTTASLQLANDLQFLLSKLGIFAGFDKQVQENRFSKKPSYKLVIEGKQVNKMRFLDTSICGSNKQYFYQDDKFFYLPCTNISVEEYEGPVYNIETIDNTYVSSFIVHNSEARENYKYYFRVLHPEEEPEELRGKHIP